MTLVKLILKAMQDAGGPLAQGEILERVLTNPESERCEELSRVKVPLSAVARQLTKYSGGSSPLFQKVGPRRYQILSSDIPPETQVMESELHPILVSYANARFNVYCKTINALKVQKRRNNQINKWSNPDIVGVSPEILNLGEIFQNEVRKLGIFSTKVLQFYSFELKSSIHKSNLTESYFQAVSNSSWANFGYLVVGDMSMDKDFLANLFRLNHGYGIGVIHLNYKDPTRSEIIVSAREREVADINFMNFLTESNVDFKDFVEEAQKIVSSGDIDQSFFDV